MISKPCRYLQTSLVKPKRRVAARAPPSRRPSWGRHSTGPLRSSMYKEAEVATLRRQITGGREGSYTSPGLKMSGIERVCLEMEYIPQNWRIHRENDDQPCDFGHIYIIPHFQTKLYVPSPNSHDDPAGSVGIGRIPSCKHGSFSGSIFIWRWLLELWWRSGRPGIDYPTSSLSPGVVYIYICIEISPWRSINAIQTRQSKMDVVWIEYGWRH